MTGLHLSLEAKSIFPVVNEKIKHTFLKSKLLQYQEWWDCTEQSGERDHFCLITRSQTDLGSIPDALD